MQFVIFINQSRAIDWGLNPPQSILFAFVYDLHSWADSIEFEGVTYYRISKAKILKELPLLTDKPDTAYRLLRQLETAGLIVVGRANGDMVVALTEKGREWNKSGEDFPVNKSLFSVDNPRKKIREPEKNPVKDGKKSEKCKGKLGKKSDISNNHISTLPDQSLQDRSGAVDSLASLDSMIAADREDRFRADFSLFCKAYPRDPYGDEAWKAFCELAPDEGLVGWILRAIAHQRRELAWHRDDGKWVPKPEKWLRQRRWLRSPGARVDQMGERLGLAGAEKNPGGQS